MSTPDERLRWLAQVRKIASEALTAHTLTDEKSEPVLLDLALNSQQQRLDQLAAPTLLGSHRLGGQTPVNPVAGQQCPRVTRGVGVSSRNARPPDNASRQKFCARGKTDLNYT
jgi:hypothetical protein